MVQSNKQELKITYPTHATALSLTVGTGTRHLKELTVGLLTEVLPRQDKHDGRKQFVQIEDHNKKAFMTQSLVY
jgi:hypothetical protein